MKGESIQTPQWTTMTIRVLATNFIRSCTPKHPCRKDHHMWKKPNQGTVKINVDASFHAENVSGACEAVARDEHGNFIVAATWILPHVSSAVSTEIKAIRSGIILAYNIGCTKIA